VTDTARCILIGDGEGESVTLEFGVDGVVGVPPLSMRRCRVALIGDGASLPLLNERNR
jgi:hypothetical protein